MESVEYHFLASEGYGLIYHLNQPNVTVKISPQQTQNAQNVIRAKGLGVQLRIGLNWIVIRVTALVATGDVEGSLQRPGDDQDSHPDNQCTYPW